MERLTIEDIKQAIYKLDVAKRPYALLVNPEDASTLKIIIMQVQKNATYVCGKISTHQLLRMI